MATECRHLGRIVGVSTGSFGDERQFACLHPKHAETTLAKCVTCRDFLPVSAPPNTSALISVAEGGPCRHPPGVVVDRYGREAGVADLYLGATCFLVLGGPSARKMNLRLLAQRGILILSCNNCPGVLPSGIRPHVWLHTDPARKFHDSIWKDPGILKIVPTREWNPGKKLKKCLRTRGADGKLTDWPEGRPRDLPGVLGFERNTCLDPEHWLFEPSINRGNDTKSSEVNKLPHTINTMFAAIKLAFYLGVKRLYLVGCDFKMSDDRPYGFNQGKGGAGVKSNNDAYFKMCVMFDSLQPKFEEAGFEVYNCTPDSGLWTFDYVPFEDAVASATAGFEQELDCEG